MKPKRWCLPLLLLLAGCGGGYDPNFKGGHGVPVYQADLARCRKQAATKTSKVANATPQSAFMSLFASAEPEREEVRSCLRSKGYVPQ